MSDNIRQDIIIRAIGLDEIRAWTAEQVKAEKQAISLSNAMLKQAEAGAKLDAARSRAMEAASRASAAESKQELAVKRTSNEMARADQATQRLSISKERLAQAAIRLAQSEERRAKTLVVETAEQRAFNKALEEANVLASRAARNPVRSMLASANGSDRAEDLRRQYSGLPASEVNRLAAAEQAKARTEARRSLAASAGNAGLDVTAGITGLALGAVADAAKFETSMQKVQNNTTMTTAQLNEMKRVVVDLGVKGGASFEDLAKGYMHVANMSFVGADATKVLDTAMKSAVATGTDVEATANILAGTLHNWKLPASEAAHVMDILHIAMQRGNMTMEEFNGAAGKALSTAAEYKQGINVVASALSALTAHQFNANEAATQWNGMIKGIVNPSKQTKDALAALEIQMKRAGITGIDLLHDFSPLGLEMRKFPGILDDLNRATRGHADLIINKLMPAQRGGRGLLALLGIANKDFKDDLNATSNVMANKSTPTQDAFNRTLQTMTNELDRAKNKIQSEFLKSGHDLKYLFDDLIKTGMGFVDVLAKALHFFSALPHPVQEVAFALGGVRLAVLALGNPLAGLAGMWGRVETAAAGAASAEAAAAGAGGAGAAGTGMFAARFAGPWAIGAALATGYAVDRIGGQFINDAAGDDASRAQAADTLTDTAIQHAIKLRSTANAVKRFGLLNQTGNDIGLPGLRGNTQFQGAGDADLNMLLQIPGLFGGSGANRSTSSDRLDALIASQQKLIDAYGTHMAHARLRDSLYGPPAPDPNDHRNVWHGSGDGMPDMSDPYNRGLAAIGAGSGSAKVKKGRHKRDPSDSEFNASHALRDAMYAEKLEWDEAAKWKKDQTAKEKKDAKAAETAEKDAKKRYIDGLLARAEIAEAATKGSYRPNLFGQDHDTAELANLVSQKAIAGNLVAALTLAPSTPESGEKLKDAQVKLDELTHAIVDLTDAMQGKRANNIMAQVSQAMKFQSDSLDAISETFNQISGSKMPNLDLLASNDAAMTQYYQEMPLSDLGLKSRGARGGGDGAMEGGLGGGGGRGGKPGSLADISGGMQGLGDLVKTLGTHRDPVTGQMVTDPGSNTAGKYLSAIGGGIGVIGQDFNQPLSLGGVVNSASQGAGIGAMFGPGGALVGAAAGGVLGILGGLFSHHHVDQGQYDTNVSQGNSPAGLEYNAYRYRVTGATGLAGPQSRFFNQNNAPQVSVFLDGIKQTVTTQINQQTSSGNAALVSAYFDAQRP